MHWGDIRKGARLKKATTVDKSKPMIDSSICIGSSPQALANSSGATNSLPSAPAVPQLGDIFAGGIPKLKHVDNRSGIVPSSAPKIPTLNTAQVPPRPTKLKRQLQSPLKNLVTCHHQFHQWHLQSRRKRHHHLRFKNVPPKSATNET